MISMFLLALLDSVRKESKYGTHSVRFISVFRNLDENVETKIA